MDVGGVTANSHVVPLLPLTCIISKFEFCGGTLVIIPSFEIQLQLTGFEVVMSLSAQQSFPAYLLLVWLGEVVAGMHESISL